MTTEGTVASRTVDQTVSSPDYLLDMTVRVNWPGTSDNVDYA